MTGGGKDRSEGSWSIYSLNFSLLPLLVLCHPATKGQSSLESLSLSLDSTEAPRAPSAPVAVAAPWQSWPLGAPPCPQLPYTVSG